MTELYGGAVKVRFMSDETREIVTGGDNEAFDDWRGYFILACPEDFPGTKSIKARFLHE